MQTGLTNKSCIPDQLIWTLTHIPIWMEMNPDCYGMPKVRAMYKHIANLDQKFAFLNLSSF